MKKIRCCILNDNTKYRGIDREVTMRIFSGEKDKYAYEDALNKYVQYISCEEEYTSQNLSFMTSFAEFVSSKYEKCEIILYSTLELKAIKGVSFLGIDIVDEHLKSIFTNKKIVSFDNKTNQNRLYSSVQDAVSEKQRLRKINCNYDELYFVYVYRILEYSDQF